MSENAPNTETKMFQVPDSSTHNILQSDGTNEVQVITGSDLRPDPQAEITASHEISADNKDGITLKLSNAWMINHLQFMVGEKGSFCSYMIWIEADQSDINPEVKGNESGNNEKWTKACDFSGVDCHGLQNVYFPMKVVRLVKILGLKTSASTTFKASSVKAFKTDLEVGDNWKLDSNWGLIAPKVAPLVINLESAEVDVNTDNPENYALKKHENGNFDVHLCQPALITSFSLVLPTGAAWETNGYITVASGSGNEEIIIDKNFDEATVDNKLELKFVNPKEMLLIKIVGLGSEREHRQPEKEEPKDESQEQVQDNEASKTKTEQQKQTKPTETQSLEKENEKVPVWATLNSEAKQRAGLVLASVFVGMVAAAVILLNISILSGAIEGNDVSNDAQPLMEYAE